MKNKNLRYIIHFCNKCNREHILLLNNPSSFCELESVNDEEISLLNIDDKVGNESLVCKYRFSCNESIYLKFVDGMYKGSFYLVK